MDFPVNHSHLLDDPAYRSQRTEMARVTALRGIIETGWLRGCALPFEQQDLSAIKLDRVSTPAAIHSVDMDILDRQAKSLQVNQEQP